MKTPVRIDRQKALRNTILVRKRPSQRNCVGALKEMIKKRLQTMLAQNSKHAEFQKLHEEMITERNSEKDRTTVRRTFEGLLKLAGSLSGEEKRAIRKGLDEESLAPFDLLLKPRLSKKEFARLKKVAGDLVTAPKPKSRAFRILCPNKPRAVKSSQVKIKYYSRDEKTGLPESFAPEKRRERSEEDTGFAHLLTSVRYHT